MQTKTTQKLTIDTPELTKLIYKSILDKQTLISDIPKTYDQNTYIQTNYMTPALFILLIITIAIFFYLTYQYNLELIYLSEIKNYFSF